MAYKQILYHQAISLLARRTLVPYGIKITPAGSIFGADDNDLQTFALY